MRKPEIWFQINSKNQAKLDIPAVPRKGEQFVHDGNLYQVSNIRYYHTFKRVDIWADKIGIWDQVMTS